MRNKDRPVNKKGIGENLFLLSRDSVLSDRLKIAMETRGLSQGALERASGLARGYVSMILSGKRGNLTETTMNRLAVALGVRQAWLAYGEEPMTENGEKSPELVGSDPTPADPVTPPDSDGVDVDPPESLPIYGNLPGWKEAEKQAKAAISLPSWVWAQARRACGVMAPQLPVTQAFVVSIAKGIYELTDPTEAMIRTNRELEKQLEALRKRHANRK